MNSLKVRNTEFHIAILLLKDLIIHIAYEEYDKTNPPPTKDVPIRNIKPSYALFSLKAFQLEHGFKSAKEPYRIKRNNIQKTSNTTRKIGVNDTTK